MRAGRQRGRVVISGRWTTTPRSLPTSTVVYCARCERRYEIDRDTLMLRGFRCECGALELEPRFVVRRPRHRHR